jgi:predicted Zn-dependent protease
MSGIRSFSRLNRRDRVFHPLFNATSAVCRYVGAAFGMAVAFCILQPYALGSSSLSPSESTDSSSAPEETVASSGCAQAKSGRADVARIGQRNVGKGINLYSLGAERSVGEAIAAAVDKQTKTVTEPKVERYISQLAQKLVRKSDAQIPFTIKVIDSTNPTTFSLPGGFLYVDQGLILEVEDEAELAGLLAHEIAHVVARHATKFATRKEALDLVSLPMTGVIGAAAVPARQIGLLPLERKVNRDFEFAADLLGIEYQYAAGYDPQAYIKALERLDAEQIQKRAQAAIKQPNPDFVDRMYIHIGRSFSPYPPTESRIARLQKQISRVLPCRNDYVLDTGEFQEVKALLRAERLVLHRRRPGDSIGGPVLERHPSQQAPH